MLSVKETRFGPVVNHIDPLIDSLYSKDIALCWSVFHLDHTAIDALYRMNHAQNMQQFEAALPFIDIVGLNVMYADIEDNIAWWGCGKIPQRDSLSESFKFLYSANSIDRPMGFLDFTENPHLINPESGFIATANNNPVLSGGDYVPGNYLPADRINLISDAIQAKDQWTVEDCKDLQLNHQSTVKRDLAHFIMTKMIDLPTSGNYRKAADELIRWDGNYGIKAVAPTIFERMYFHIAQQSYADELGFDLFEKGLSTYMFKKSLPDLIHSEESPWWNKHQSNEAMSREKILTLSFMMSVDELSRELGDNVSKWEWGEVNQLTHEHPMGSVKPLDKSFNVGPFAVAGGNQVPNKMESDLSNESIHFVNSGPAVRMIIDFTDVGAALNITPTGQSGNFRSPFYKDQAPMYVDGVYRGMLMDREKLGEDTKRLVLKP
jgi:penicillin amidase